VAAARDCRGAELIAHTTAETFSLVLREAGRETSVAQYELGPTLGGSALNDVGAKLEMPTVGRDAALLAMLKASANSDVRLYIAGKRRYLGIDGSDALTYSGPA